MECGGNSFYVTFTGTNGALFFSMDFIIPDGQGAATTNIRWEACLDSALTRSGAVTDVTKSTVIGWQDTVNGLTKYGSPPRHPFLPLAGGKLQCCRE